MNADSGRAEDSEKEKPEDQHSPGASVEGESIADVLASIRALVSEESRSRQATPGQDLATVLVLTPEMAVTPTRSGEILSAGLDSAHAGARNQPAPILDEEALRGVINTLVREELQGELGDRISRNLRKLIRRELAQMLEEQKRDDD